MGENFNWQVDKFSGYCIGKYLNLIPLVVENRLNSDTSKKLVVVVSALSKADHNQSGTTSRLIQLFENYYTTTFDEKLTAINIILSEHVGELNFSIKDEITREKYRVIIEKEIENTKIFLKALEVIGEITLNTIDIFISLGERLAGYLVLAKLEESNISCEFLDLSLVIERKENFNLDSEESFLRLADTFKQKVLKKVVNDTQVVVVPGFFGVVKDGLFNKLSRGYSDVTAALLAKGFNCPDLTLFKLVEGIFSADPNVVPEAKLLKKVSTDEAYELSYYGVQSVHPIAIELASKFDMLLKVVGIQQLEESIKVDTKTGLVGTTIFPVVDDYRNTLATAITIKRGVVVVNVHSNRKVRSHDFFSRVFKILNKFQLVTDLVATSEVHISLALTNPNVNQLNNAKSELDMLGEIDVIYDQTIISLIGRQMHHKIGVAKSFFKGLADAGASLQLISQGSSEINISVVVKDYQVDQAVRNIHGLLCQT